MGATWRYFSTPHKSAGRALSYVLFGGGWTFKTLWAIFAMGQLAGTLTMLLSVGMLLDGAADLLPEPRSRPAAALRLLAVVLAVAGGLVYLVLLLANG